MHFVIFREHFVHSIILLNKKLLLSRKVQDRILEEVVLVLLSCMYEYFSTEVVLSLLKV
jgi:hypothetical protein